MRYSNDGGTTWSSPARITDQSSMSDFIFIGDHIDSSATNRKAWVLWTDRADKTSIYDDENDVFADQV
jgi:hypothetical protein